MNCGFPFSMVDSLLLALFPTLKFTRVINRANDDCREINGVKGGCSFLKRGIGQMGQMRFHTSYMTDAELQRLRRCYMVGMEGIAWERELSISEKMLVIDRSTHESGKLFVPWLRMDGVEVILSTSSLREQEAEYHLEVELARGTLNRLRNYLANRNQHFEISAAYQSLLNKSQQSFMNAVLPTDDPESSQRNAADSIETALELIELVVLEDAGHAVEIRYQAGGLKPLIGIEMPVVPESEQSQQQIDEIFNTVTIPFNWRTLSPDTDKFNFDEIDGPLHWALQHDKKIIAGPLVRLTDESIPEWMYLWESDFTAFQNYLVNYVGEVIQRYKGRVHVWHCAAGLNSMTGLRFSEEQVVRIAVDVVETIRRIDAKTPIVMSFDVPWGGYAADRRTDLSPLQFAEALVRGDIGLNGIGLELNFGDGPNECGLYDSLAINALMSRWSQLQLPLVLSISTENKCILPGVVDGDLSDSDELNDAVDSPSAGLGSNEVANLLMVLASQGTTQAILWNQLSDTPERRAGLYTDVGQSKPLINDIRRLCKEQLGI